MQSFQQSQWNPVITPIPVGGGGWAPTNATYITTSLNWTLSQERVLTAWTW
jgi:hypothetical protein